MERGEASRPSNNAPRSLLEEQAIALVDELQSREQNSNIVVVWLALFTGMRRGEALGLTWRNVTLSKAELHLEQQFARDKTLRPLKTPASQRSLTIDNATIDFLTNWRARQKQIFDDFGLEWSDDVPVCANELGDFMDPDNFSRWRRGFFVDIGLGKFTKQIEYVDSTGTKRIRYTGYKGPSLHDLRHTQATILIGMGFDLKTVQARLGHESPLTTISIYAEAIKKKQQEAAAGIGDLLTRRE
jgi:integrase